MVATSGTPKGRALAAALRRARQGADVSVREVGRRLNLPHSVVSYWETGKRIPKPEDIGGYLAAIGVTGDERERVLKLVRGAAESNWLAAGIPGISEGLNGVLECERTTVSIVEWSPLVVSGLLQTSDYAKAIFGAGEGPASITVEARALLRAGRRDMFNKTNPTRLHALIGEPVLHTPVGGHRVLLDQLYYLRKVATEVEPVTVQVVRTKTPWHPGLAGPFVFYEFEDSPAIVHLEHHRSSAFLFEEPDVTEYAQVATTLREKTAMSPQDSTKLITNTITKLEKTESRCV